MLELIVGIVLGAAFHEFWKDLFVKAKNKINGWMDSLHNHSSTGE